MPAGAPPIRFLPRPGRPWTALSKPGNCPVPSALPRERHAPGRGRRRPRARRRTERQEARERAYQDVSLRAVELLANAQRAAAWPSTRPSRTPATSRRPHGSSTASSSSGPTRRPARRPALHRLRWKGRRRTARAGREPDGNPRHPRPSRPSSSTTSAPTPGWRTHSRGAVLGALNVELEKLAGLAQAGGAAAPAASEPDEPGDGGSSAADARPDGHDARRRGRHPRG